MKEGMKVAFLTLGINTLLIAGLCAYIDRKSAMLILGGMSVLFFTFAAML